MRLTINDTKESINQTTEISINHCDNTQEKGKEAISINNYLYSSTQCNHKIIPAIEHSLNLKTLICFALLISFSLMAIIRSYHYHSNLPKKEILFNQSNITLGYIKSNELQYGIQCFKFIFMIPIGIAGIYVLNLLSKRK